MIFMKMLEIDLRFPIIRAEPAALDCRLQPGADWNGRIHLIVTARTEMRGAANGCLKNHGRESAAPAQVHIGIDAAMARSSL